MKLEWEIRIQNAKYDNWSTETSGCPGGMGTNETPAIIFVQLNLHIKHAH